MITNQINKPNLAINRLSVGVDDRKKWASSEKRARAAKKRVSEERREEISVHPVFLSYFLPMLSPLSWNLEQAKPNTDLNSLRMLINSVITCLWQEVWQLCKTNVSIVLVPLSFLFSGYALWSAERYHAIFLSNQTRNQDQSNLISAAFSAFEFYSTNIPGTTVLLLIK